MSLYDLFETEKSAEVEGFELQVHDGEVEVKFMLARAGGANRQFISRLQALLKPYKKKMEKGTMKDEDSERCLVRALAETVILSWTGVRDREGEEIEFSVENAVTLLTELPDLRDLIFEEAQNVANFQAIDREEMAGN